MHRAGGDNEHPLADLYPGGESRVVVGDDYRPTRPVAKWAIGFLVVALVLDVVAFASDISERSLLGQGVITVSEADANDDRQSAIALAQLVALIATAIFFIRWIHRAYKNLLELGTPDLRFKPGWAIGGWFVPILNLWRPKQIVNDTWRATDPGLDPDAAGTWRLRDVPGWVALWWGAFLLSGLAWRASGQITSHAESRGDLRTANLFSLIGDVSSTVAAITAVLLVQSLTARQEQRAARISNEA